MRRVGSQNSQSVVQTDHAFTCRPDTERKLVFVQHSGAAVFASLHSRPSSRYVKKMKNTDKDDYKVIFGGATISKREAKKVLIAFVFGMLGIVTIGLIFGLKNKVVVFIVSFILAGIGYFDLANRFNKK